MTNMPWGPHGPEVPPHTVLPNPTAPSPPQQILGSDQAPGPIAAGGGADPLGTIAANIIVSLLMLAMLWIPMVCLYPVTAVAGMVAGFGSAPLFIRMFPPDARDVGIVLGLVVGVVVGLKANRIEFRLAENPAFRLMRHVLRMVLLAVWAIPIIQLSTGTAAPTTSTAYILAVATSPRALAAFLSQPRNLLIWVVAVVGLHFLIWSGDSVRRFWHRRLKWLGLK